LDIHQLFGPIAANDNSERKCPTCGGDVSGHPSKKFCCAKCRRLNEKSRRNLVEELKRRRETAPERTCEYCGTVFRRGKDSHNAARFCSRKCGFEAKSNVWRSPPVDNDLRSSALDLGARFRVTRCLCVQCGQRFVGGNITAMYCSIGCQRQAFWRRRGVDPAPRRCPECDVVFEVVYGRGAAVFCSDECSAKHNRRKVKWRRKARMRSVANDNIDPFYVFDRDGWRCKLCGVSTPKRLRGTYDDRAPELDHILPISLGGSHTLDNVQCACRKCNGAKGATPMGQTLLFG